MLITNLGRTLGLFVSGNVLHLLLDPELSHQLRTTTPKNRAHTHKRLTWRVCLTADENRFLEMLAIKVAVL